MSISSSRSKKAALAASLAAIFGTIAFLSIIPSISNIFTQSSAGVGIDSLPLSASPPSSSSPTNNNDDESPIKYHRRLSNALPNGGCEITWPKKPPAGVQIAYAASYPGCGARMMWNLVEALTGMWTGDDWNNNGRGEEVVTVKTHYPQSNGILVDFDEKIQRGFIVIRNPMKSIPSFFNHIYEMRNHLPVHSERAPLEEWIKWRNAYLETEIAEYRKFIIYWMDRYTPENRLLLTYEGLTDDTIGVEVAKGLNEWLGQAEGVSTIDPDSVGCIWRAVVKNEPPPQQAEHIKKLEALARNDQAPGVQVEPSSGQTQRQERGNQQLSKADLLTQTLENIQQKPLKGGEAPANDDPSALEQQLQEAQQKLQLVQDQINDSQQQQQQQLQPNDQQALPLDKQLLKTQQKLLDAQALLGNNRGSGLRHRRLDPGHHNSQRHGPQVPRPYEPKQLDMMMNMLLEVAQRYAEADARLYHIMMGYYEQIRGERAMLSLDEPSSVVKPPGGFY